MALQGFLLFGVNYMCVYLAETEITSGLVAVAFSLLVILNIVGTRVFFGTPLKPSALLGAVLGIGGIGLVFLPEIGRATGGGKPTPRLPLPPGGGPRGPPGDNVAAPDHGRGV